MTNDVTTLFQDLTDKQRTGALMAAAGHSCNDIAQHLKVRPETVSRWSQIPSYKQLLYSTANTIRDDEMSRITDLRKKAFDALEAALDNIWEPKLRLQAAVKILELTEPVQSYEAGSKQSS